MSLSTKIDEIRQEVEGVEVAYNELRDLMFTNERNLSEGGKGLIKEIKRRSMRQKDAVRILGISPSAAYNHWHDV
ncbi:hypothetical protein [Methylobacterium sp. CM6244]